MQNFRVWDIAGALVISKHSSCLGLDSKHTEGSKYAKYHISFYLLRT